MGMIPSEKVQDVAKALRQRATFFLDSDPKDLSREDFATIGGYLQGLAESLEGTAKRLNRGALLRGLATCVVYAVLLGVLCHLFYQYGPYEDKYYLKLAREVFSQEHAAELVFYFRAGAALFCALFVFFLSVFCSIILCAVCKLFLPRLVNSLTESVVASLLASVAYYLYYEHVFKTGLAKSFL